MGFKETTNEIRPGGQFQGFFRSGIRQERAQLSLFHQPFAEFVTTHFKVAISTHLPTEHTDDTEPREIGPGARSTKYTNRTKALIRPSIPSHPSRDNLRLQFPHS